MKSIIGIGNALTDVLAVMPDTSILKKYNLPIGSMQWVDRQTANGIWEDIKDLKIQIVPGGSAANTIAGAAILGMRSAFVGMVGDDAPGRLFKESQESIGIHPHLLTGKDASGRAIVFITPPNAERTFADYMGAALELGADDLKDYFFAGYDILHIEGYLVQNHDLVRRAVQICAQLGMTISIDLASYNVVESNYDFLHEIVEKYVDIVFANETEAKAFTGKGPQEALEDISRLCKIAVVKVGKEGSLVKSGQKIYRIDPFLANAVDATGAGDLYAAGFLYGFAQDLPLDICGSIGSYVSSRIVEVVGTKLDGTSWKNIKEEVARIIAEG